MLYALHKSDKPSKSASVAYIIYIDNLSVHPSCKRSRKFRVGLVDGSIHIIYGPRCEKACLREFANNTSVDQPAHTRSLISAFVIRVLESTISKRATSEISVF